MRFTILAVLTMLVRLADAAGFTYVPIPGTNNIQAIANTFPTGTFTANNTLATPFSISAAPGKCGPSGAAPCNYYDGFGFSGSGESITLNVSVTSATDVYTLINAYKPAPGQQLATIKFVGSGGASLTFPLIGGEDIRDYNNSGVWANTLTNGIAGVQAVNAFACSVPSTCMDASGVAGNLVIDEQHFSLGSTFAGQTLTQIVFTDSFNGSSPILFGVTVASGVQAPNSWTTGAPMPTPRTGVFTGAIGENIYVIGGNNNTTGVMSVNEVFDTTTGTWSTAAPMPTARTLGASAVVGNILYAMGGGNNTAAVNTVEAYDPSTDTWTTKASMPIANGSVYATVANNIIYVVGGCCLSGGVRLGNVMSYNPATNIWSVLAPLKTAKSQSALGFLGSMVVSAGGLLTNSNATTDNEGYTIANNTWSTLAPLPTPRHAGCFETVADTLYFAGGHTVGNGSPLTTTDSYNFDTNSWTSGLATMPHAAVNMGSAGVEGRLYCFGGSDAGDPGAGNVFNYTQIYQPQISGAPSILTGGIVNAASYAASNGVGSPVAPGALVAIFTSTLATQPANFSTASLPDSLAGVGVTFNGITAPIVAVSPTGAFPYVSAQVPFEVLPPGQTSAAVPAVVTVNNAPSAAVQVSIVASAPGIFTIPANGQGNAILVFVNPATNAPAIAGPTTASLGYPSAPIPRGTGTFFYVTGLGAMTPPVPDGSGTCPAPNGQCNANAMPTVLVGGITAQVAFAGQAPEFPGVFQVNITIPQNAPTGDSVSLVVQSADGSVASNTATIAVQ